MAIQQLKMEAFSVSCLFCLLVIRVVADARLTDVYPFA